MTHPPLAPRNQTDLVTATGCKPRDCLADRQSNSFLTFPRRSKRAHGTTGVNDQDNLHIRAGLVTFDDRSSGSSGRSPVDVFNVITGLVFGHVHEFPALSRARRIVLALHERQKFAQDRQLGPASKGTQLRTIRSRLLVLVDIAQGLRAFLDDPPLNDWTHGTATAEKTASMRPSTEISSAIASKVRMIR